MPGEDDKSHFLHQDELTGGTDESVESEAPRPQNETRTEVVKTPEQVSEEIGSSADFVVDQFKADIPESAAKDPLVESLVEEAESAHQTLDVSVSKTLSDENIAEASESKTNESEEVNLDAKTQGMMFFERQYSETSATQGLTPEEKAKQKAQLEAYQGKIAEGDIDSDITFSYEHDGKTEEVTEQGVIGYLQGELDKEQAKLGEEKNVESTERIAELQKLLESLPIQEASESKENSREQVTQALENGLAAVERMFEGISDEEKASEKGKELGWIIKSVTSAKEKTIDAGTSTYVVELLDENGNPRLDDEGNPATQQEGIPVEGIIKVLKDREEIINAEDLTSDEQKRLKQLEEIIPQNTSLEKGGVVASTEPHQQRNIDEMTPLLEKKKKFEERKQAIIDSLPSDKSRRVKQLQEIIPQNESLTKGGVVASTEPHQQRNIEELNALLEEAEASFQEQSEQLSETLITLEDNSKPYFEQHFGKNPEELTEEEKKLQHMRTEHEAHLIAQDHRATGTPEGDYALAMETMSDRRELILPEEATEEEDEVVTPLSEDEEAETAPEDEGQEDDSEDTPEPIPQPKPGEDEGTTEKTEEGDKEKEKDEEGAEEKPSIETLRNAYAAALNGRKKFKVRVSEAQVEELRKAYEGAIREKIHQQLVEEFEGMDKKNRDVMEAYLLAQAEAATGVLKERELLVEALNETQEKTTGKKFKDFWKKHAKVRMVIGLALTGGAVVTGAMGLLPVSAALLAGRVALTTVGTTMVTEAAWEGTRQRLGKTKEFSQEDVSRMKTEKLEEIYAAQSVGAADRGLKRDEKITFFGRKKESKAAGLIEAELKKRRLESLKEAVKLAQSKGLTDEKILEMSTRRMILAEEQGHRQLESRTDWLRKNNIKKWITAGSTGLIAGALVGVSGFSKLKDMAEAQVPGSPEGGAPGAGAEGGADGVPEGPPTPSDGPEGFAPPPAEGDVVPNPETAIPPEDAIGSGEGLPGDAAGSGAGAGVETIPGTEAAGSAETIVTVGKGDSVWKIVEDQLKERMGEKFTALSEGEKTHLIDQFKDRIVENPGKFGISNPDALTPGDKMNLTELFQGSSVEDAMSQTAELSQDQISNIEANNEILRKWVLEHPGERLTEANVDSIIAQAKQGIETVAGPDGASVAEHLSQDVSSEDFAAQYSEWLSQNPDAAQMRPMESLVKFAAEQQVQSGGESIPEVYNPIADWIDQNPGKALDKETFLKLVNGPTAQEALEASGQVGVEATGRIPEALESLAKYNEFVNSGEVIELQAGIKAMRQAGEVTSELIKDGNEETVRGLTDLKLSDIMRGVKTKLEKMPGMTEDMAKKFGKAAKHLVQQADKANGTPVDRDWTMGMLSRVVRLVEKGK